MSATLAAVLVRRGLADPEEATRFLSAGERHDPRALPGLTGACELILGHVRADRASPCTATTTWTESAPPRSCSGRSAPWAPIRPGRSPAASTTATGCPPPPSSGSPRAGVGLLVTVDCGITAVAEVAAARAAGMDVVVTDHHRPGPELPGCPVVHPALGDYPCPELVRGRRGAQALGGPPRRRRP